MPPTYTVTNGVLYSGGKPVIVDASGHIPLPPLSGLGLLDELTGGNLIPSPEDAFRSNPLTTIKDTASATVSAAKATVAAGQWLSDRNNWIRIAKVLLGAAMMIEGINMMVSKAVTPQIISAVGKGLT